MSRHCQFPGCAVCLDHKGNRARWCKEHARSIRLVRNNGMRRATAAVKTLVRSNSDGQRLVTVHCKVCYGQPWARAPGRGRESYGGFDDAPVVGDDGLCLGCGLPYAPEPRERPEATIASSAGLAIGDD